MAEPPFARPDVAAFVALLGSQPGPSFAEIGAAEARATMASMGTMFDIEMGEIALDAALSAPRPDGGTIALRLFDARAQRGASPVVVFFHGGGFVLGDLARYASGCAAIARRLDLPVVSVDYRLAPEHCWPAAPDDCEATARFVATGAGLGHDVTGLILMGDSAGGGLAVVTAMALRDRPAAVPVLAQCALYPVVDQAREHPSYEAFAEGYLLQRADMRWFLDSYAADRADWRASPLYGRHADMPPTLIATCSLDPLRDEGRAYAAALVSAGISTAFYEAEGMVHGFLSMRKAMPSAVADLERCLDLLAAMLPIGPADR